jgi:hypothetical protein
MEHRQASFYAVFAADGSTGLLLLIKVIQKGERRINPIAINEKKTRHARVKQMDRRAGGMMKEGLLEITLRAALYPGIPNPSPALIIDINKVLIIVVDAWRLFLHNIQT